MQLASSEQVQDPGMSLLAQDASEELLEFELQATPASRAAQHMLEEYEHQLRGLHLQVDQLQAQLINQAHQQELIQADFNLQLSILQERLSRAFHGGKTVYNDVEQASQMLEGVRMQMQQLGSNLRQAQKHGVATNQVQELLDPTAQELELLTRSFDAALRLLSDAATQHVAIVQLCDADDPFNSGPATPADANTMERSIAGSATKPSPEVRRMEAELTLAQTQLRAVCDREASTSKQLAAADELVKSLEGEVRNLQQRQETATSRLVQLQDEVATIQQQLLQASDVLGAAASTEPEAGDLAHAQDFLAQSVAAAEAHAASISSCLAEWEAYYGHTNMDLYANGAGAGMGFHLDFATAAFNNTEQAPQSIGSRAQYADSHAALRDAAAVSGVCSPARSDIAAHSAGIPSYSGDSFDIDQHYAYARGFPKPQSSLAAHEGASDAASVASSSPRSASSGAPAALGGGAQAVAASASQYANPIYHDTSSSASSVSSGRSRSDSQPLARTAGTPMSAAVRLLGSAGTPSGQRSSSHDDMLAAASYELEQLREAHAELTSNHATAVAQHEQAMSELQAAHDALKADYDTATIAWEALSATKKWMTEEISSLQAEVQEAKSCAQASAARVAELQQQLKARNEAAAAAAAAARAAVDGQREALQAAQATAEATTWRADHTASQLAEREHELQVVRQALQDALSSYKTVEREREHQMLQAQQRMVELQRQLEEHKSEAEVLRSQPGETQLSPQGHASRGLGFSHAPLAASTGRTVHNTLGQTSSSDSFGRTGMMAESMMLHNRVIQLQAVLDKAADQLASSAMDAALAELQSESLSMQLQASTGARLLPVASRGAAQHMAGEVAAGHVSALRALAGAGVPAPHKPSPDATLSAHGALASMQQALASCTTSTELSPSGVASSPRAQLAAISPRPGVPLAIPNTLALPSSSLAAVAAGSPSNDVHELRLQVTQLLARLEVETLRGSNAELQLKVSDVELASAKARIKELEATARDLRTHVQDLQMQLGFLRMHSRSGAASLGNTSGSDLSTGKSSQMRQIAEIGAALAAAGNADGALHQGGSPATVSRRSSLIAAGNKRASGSGSPAQRIPQAAAPAAVGPSEQQQHYALALQEVRTLVTAELLPMSAHTRDAAAQAGALAKALPELRSMLASVLQQGEAAAAQLEHQAAVAAAAQRELHRSQQVYKESQGMLQALYDEAHHLNGELWSQNAQLSAERDGLEAELMDALDQLEEAKVALHTAGSSEEPASASGPLTGGATAAAPAEAGDAADASIGLSQMELSGHEQRTSDEAAHTEALRSGRLRQHSASSATSRRGSRMQPAATPSGPRHSLGSIDDAGVSVAAAGGQQQEAQQLRVQLAASQQQVQKLQQKLLNRNRLVTELEAQLLGVSDDIKTFESTVIRVEVLASTFARHAQLQGQTLPVLPMPLPVP